MGKIRELMNNVWVVLLLLLALGPAVYVGLKTLIINEMISPEIISLLIIYIVGVIPQYNAIYALKIIMAVEDGDPEQVTAGKLNLLPVINDFTLASIFGKDTMFRTITGLTMVISVSLFAFTIVYFNVIGYLINVPQLTSLMALIQVISIITYFVSKTIVLMTLINLFGGSLWKILSAILHPLGFMVLVGSTKVYLYQRDIVSREEALGYSLDDDY